MKHDCKPGEEVKGIFVEDGVLDVQQLAKILRALQSDGRVFVTGVKKLDLPPLFLEACASFCETN